MKLYFQTEINQNGNRKQLILDTETNETRRGYFLFQKCDAITVKARDLDKIEKQADETRRTKCL